MGNYNGNGYTSIGNPDYPGLIVPSNDNGKFVWVQAPHGSIQAPTASGRDGIGTNSGFTQLNLEIDGNVSGGSGSGTAGNGGYGIKLPGINQLGFQIDSGVQVTGGNGANGDPVIPGLYGGSGGVGVKIATNNPSYYGGKDNATNNGTIMGGMGGGGFPSQSPVANGGGGAIIGLYNTGTFINNGTIEGGGAIDGAGGFGLQLNGSRSPDANAAFDNNGTIEGGSGAGTFSADGGVGVTLDYGNFVNEGGGTVQGGDNGFALAAEIKAGSFTNDGLITGGVHEYAGSVANAGTIAGVVTLYGGTLVVDPGAKFDFGAGVHSGDTGTLELSDTELSTGTGITLGGSSNSGNFSNFSTLHFDSSAKWTVDVNAQTYTSSSGNNAPVGVQGFASGDTIHVAGQTPHQVGQDFNGVSLVQLGTGTYGFNGGSGESLQIAGDSTANLSFSGNYTGQHFVLSADGHGGTDVTVESGTLPAPCYRRGTRIRTTRGEQAVEDLHIGDLVLTAGGQLRPVRWLGYRSLECGSHPEPASIWPIRITAGAFANQLPARDLWVSPGHSLFIEGVLIQAYQLVNGVTILQVPCERVQYWHVQLDRHDIVFAEGLPAESYLDTGNRSAFSNGGAFVEAFPDFAPKHWAQTCVPLVLEGAAVQRTRQALLARAHLLGYEITQDADAHVIADGRRIDPIALTDTRMAFLLPSTTASAELRCRSFIPAHVQPDSADRRALGLCVSRLQFDGATLALSDDSAYASGWHTLEGDRQHWRWSTSRVPLPAGLRLLVIDLLGPGFYWIERVAAASDRPTRMRQVSAREQLI